VVGRHPGPGRGFFQGWLGCWLRWRRGRRQGWRQGWRRLNGGRLRHRDDPALAAQFDPDVVSTPGGHEQETVARRVLGDNLALHRPEFGERVLIVGRQQVRQHALHRLDGQRPLGKIGRARRRQHVRTLANMHDEPVPICFEDCGDERINGRHVSHLA
jgi:hypothetical protein